MSSRPKDSKRGGSKPKRGKGLSLSEKLAIPLILIISVWAVYSFSQPSHATSTSQLSASTAATSQIGAPDFTLPVVGPNGLTGNTVSLSSFRGRVVLLEFMEPWCPHCQNMEPVLENLYQQYGAHNVVFLTVAGPWQGATADDTATFIRDHNSGWVYVYDASGSVFKMYDITGTPTFFIIGKGGSVAADYSGEVPSDTIAADLNRLNG